MDVNHDEIKEIDTTDVEPQDENDKKCAPGIKYDNISCIKLNVLIEMARMYNETISDEKDRIKMSNTLATLNPRKYKKHLVNEFNIRLGNKCKTQKCWTELDFVKKMRDVTKQQLKSYTFRPDGPSENGKFVWLNTNNINDVMTQYELRFPDFKFIGAVPIDFDDLRSPPYPNVKNLDYDELVKNGKHKLGFIFNLDKHNEPGSHWVGMYADIKLGNVYFFDSYGTEAPPQIRKLMRRIVAYCKEKGINARADYNKVRQQRKGSECGVYSINFILRMLDGKTLSDIEQEQLPDDKVNVCRVKYFGNLNKKINEELNSKGAEFNADKICVAG